MVFDASALRIFLWCLLPRQRVTGDAYGPAYAATYAPGVARKNAQSTPLTVAVENEISAPSRVMVATERPDATAGTMATRFLAPVPTARVKLRALPFQASEPKDEPLRPSSHSRS